MLHIRKLCVGVDDIGSLREWQEYRLREEGVLFHRTRNTPRRGAEILEGGSMYWIIRGRYSVRQRIIGFDSETAEEVIAADPSKSARAHCLILLDSELVRVLPRRHRAFQGWRYLEDKEKPPDISSGDLDDADPEFIEALSDIGIIM